MSKWFVYIHVNATLCVCVVCMEAGRGLGIPGNWSSTVVSYHVGAGAEPQSSQGAASAVNS